MFRTLANFGCLVSDGPAGGYCLGLVETSIDAFNVNKVRKLALEIIPVQYMIIL